MIDIDADSGSACFLRGFHLAADAVMVGERFDDPHRIGAFFHDLLKGLITFHADPVQGMQVCGSCRIF